MLRILEYVGRWQEYPCRLAFPIDAKGKCFIRIGAKSYAAPRVAFRLFYGYLPEECCHHCDTPNCIEPSHLWDGTHAENMADSSKKGRQLGTARRLTIHDARIRDLFVCGASKLQISKYLGVSWGTVHRALRPLRRTENAQR